MAYLVTQMALCLVIAFLLGLLVGWWWQSQRCERRIAAIESDRQKSTVAAANTTAAPAPVVRETPSALAETATADDLTKIEGIGPATAEILSAAGIDSYEGLADTAVSDLRQILRQAGEGYASHDPGSWPAQARLAARGEWNALAQLQEELRGGRRVDDLTLIEGIGPKVEALLRAAGVSSFAALAAMKPEAIRALLDEGGRRFRICDPGTWPEQAELAASGEWTILARVQDDLRAGRIPDAGTDRNAD